METIAVMATRLFLLVLLTACLGSLAQAADTTLEDLKKRVEQAKPEDQPAQYSEIARKELDVANERLNDGKGGEAMEYLEESVADAIRAGEAATKVHKRQKETEIVVRHMVSRMKDMQRLVSYDDSQLMLKAITRLEQVRSDLLASMFSKDKK